LAERNAGGSRTHLLPLCRRQPDRLAPASIVREYPRQESNLIANLRRVGCGRHIPRTTIARIAPSRTDKSRRLDSHQYEPTYEVGAFLSRATSAMDNTSGRGPGGNRTRTLRFTAVRAAATTLQAPSIRRAFPAAEGAGVEPARLLRSPGFQPGPVASRVAPPKVPRPGIEPGTSRSKRGMMSVSPPG
jgi:hypothetical protein